MPRVRERLSITRISAGPAEEVPLNLRGAFALMRRETAKSRLPKILPAGVTEGQREQDRERERERERERKDRDEGSFMAVVCHAGSPI